jgi:hypothetical protein
VTLLIVEPVSRGVATECRYRIVPPASMDTMRVPVPPRSTPTVTAVAVIENPLGSWVIAR